MKMAGNEKRYRLPGDPGPWTLFFWALEDYWWRTLERSDRQKVALLGLAMAVWVAIIMAGR